MVGRVRHEHQYPGGGAVGGHLGAPLHHPHPTLPQRDPHAREICRRKIRNVSTEYGTREAL